MFCDILKILSYRQKWYLSTLKAIVIHSVMFADTHSLLQNHEVNSFNWI